MALHTKSPEVERLAAEVAALAHETKTEALGRLLGDHIWPGIPPERLGQPRPTTVEKEETLGYGPGGV